MNEITEFANNLARSEFKFFAQRAFNVIEPSTPFEWNWHIDCISEHLEAVRRGEIRRLIINMPPRSLKTMLVSVLFPAWVLGNEPHERFITTSFKFERAVQMSLACRTIIESDWYRSVFARTRIDPSQGQKHNFMTTERGLYYSSAIGSVTGAGASYIICDDPLAPDEAISDTIRNGVNQTIRGTLFSRFNDPRVGRFVMVMQRLHEDDPTGNLAKEGGYTVLKLPAEAKHPVSIALGDKHTWHMDAGDLLFPARLNRDVLTELRRNMTEAAFCGQYLQEPVPLGGGEFKDTWVNYYQAGGVQPKTMNVAILVDAAGGEELQKKKRKLSDYTAMMVVGKGRDQNYYLLDVVRDRLNPTERVEMLFDLHEKWNGLAGKPPKVGYEKYGMMTDTHYIRERQRLSGYNFSLIELGGQMIKEERIRRLIPDMQNGRWYFPANLLYTDKQGRTFDLVRELVNSEMLTFPKSKYDDCLDALSRVYEADLGLAFPKAEVRQAQRMVNEMYMEQPSSWMDW